jgi:hypothetical protein
MKIVYALGKNLPIYCCNLSIMSFQCDGIHIGLVHLVQRAKKIIQAFPYEGISITKAKSKNPSSKKESNLPYVGVSITRATEYVSCVRTDC